MKFTSRRLPFIVVPPLILIAVLVVYLLSPQPPAYVTAPVRTGNIER
ncbi:hypothetical protein HCE77_004288 [Salmonella enterica]|nr:hypothetical protein [Salmonella enterica]EIG1433909.1 hypothetical protein [Salmonella enterica]EIG1438560.1 hypothetical protein [Salmonella enterica]